MTRSWRRRGLPALLLLLATTLSADVTAFLDVNVVPMTDERTLARQTVIVRGDRIERIGPVDEVAIPPDARVILGGGRWLVPGLIDSHVHIRVDDLEQYLRYGITTVRDLAGLPSVIDAAARVRRGELAGPEIIYSSLLMNGPNFPTAPGFAVVVTDPNLALPIVRAQKANGARIIKLYENLSLQVYEALVAAARAEGMQVAGHVSQNVDIRLAVQRQDSIEHLAGYDRVVTRRGGGSFGRWVSVDESRFSELVQATVAGGAWNCPTLHVFKVLAARDMNAADVAAMAENRRRFVKALRDGGAPLLVGTDSGGLVDAGIATHDELAEMIAAGLTPFEAIAAATRAPARFLGMEHEVGTIAPGLRADLLLVDANPLEQPEVLRRPTMVMARGVWVGGRERRRAVRR